MVLYEALNSSFKELAALSPKTNCIVTSVKHEVIWNDDSGDPNYKVYDNCVVAQTHTGADPDTMKCGLWFSKGQPNPKVEANLSNDRVRVGTRYRPITNVDEIRFKPVKTDIIYSLVSTDGGLVDSQVTHIESTGYFGDAKRKVVAKIDRQTNQLIGIFDYALYSQEAIKP